MPDWPVQIQQPRFLHSPGDKLAALFAGTLWVILAGGMGEALDDDPNPSDQRLLARAVSQL